MIKEKPKEWYKNLSQEEKDRIKEYQRQKYQEMVEYKKEALQNKWFLFFLYYEKMSEKILDFDNITLNKKEFYKSKQPIDLTSVNTGQTAASD